MAMDQEISVRINVGDATLPGDLYIPGTPKGLVVFSHGSGSSRLSERNRFVAGRLQRANFATLLFDLLTRHEDENFANRFDIDLLTARLAGAVRFVEAHEAVKNLPVGLFGASTGAASALKASTYKDIPVRAVVSRGGRPDLAGSDLSLVRCPTLLIVGGLDNQVIELNQEASQRLPKTTECRLEIVPGATHLFEEPGTLEQVAELASNWFVKYLPSAMPV